MFHVKQSRTRAARRTQPEQRGRHHAAFSPVPDAAVRESNRMLLYIIR